jgi:hypothetical protein
MFVVVSVQMAVDMFGDPELTLGGALFLSLLAFGISFAILYVGWRMWKSDKRSKPEPPVTNTVRHGSGAPPREPVSGPYGNPGSGRTALSGAAGASGAQNEPFTVECPGCGAPVEVSPSKSGVCEYCGNQVQYRRA